MVPHTILVFVLSFLFYQKDSKILFVGDSMTSYRNGWHHQMANKMGVQYTNLSVPGKRTLWMYNTLSSHLLTNNNYKTCFIYGGINDGFSYVKLQSVVENVQKMVDLCNKNGIEPVVVIGYNPQKVMVGEKMSEFHVNRYIEIQKLFIRDLSNCKIISMNEDINRKDSDDGVHFIASGHRKFATWVYQEYMK